MTLLFVCCFEIALLLSFSVLDCSDARRRRSRATASLEGTSCSDTSGISGTCTPMQQCPSKRQSAPSEPLCESADGVTNVCCSSESTSGDPTEDPVQSAEMALLLSENHRFCGKHLSFRGRRPNRINVIGGRRVKLGKYKFAVAIFTDEVSMPNFWCGGTLITKKMVLSAAHCFHGELGNASYVARVGGVNINHGAGGGFVQERRVSSIHLHPEYKDKQFYADVAVLVLDRPVNFGPMAAPAACLPDTVNVQPPDQRGVVLGWGHNVFGGRLQTRLQEADVPFVKRDQCNEAYQSLTNYRTAFPQGIDDNFICAGNITVGGVDACQHDSGGPLVVGSANEGSPYWEVVGVVSFGVRCGVAEYPGVYTRISTVLPWILRTASQVTT